MDWDRAYTLLAIAEKAQTWGPRLHSLRDQALNELAALQDEAFPPPAEEEEQH